MISGNKVYAIMWPYEGPSCIFSTRSRAEEFIKNTAGKWNSGRYIEVFTLDEESDYG